MDPAMKHIVRILDITRVTHDVKCFRMEKPPGFRFTPGQATDLSVNQAGMEEETRPFTFTALNAEPYLELTIKRYADHHGVTDRLHTLGVGDELIISDSWGAIEYKGPGYFIAGGAGITPFVAILRSLYQDNSKDLNTLYFSNKTASDIIYQDELIKILHGHVDFILTREKKEAFHSGRIDRQFIMENIKDFKKHFYVCGPDAMVAEITDTLQKLGAATDELVFEK
jgi:ferredoxin-NADP reductase